jgi:integrase
MSARTSGATVGRPGPFRPPHAGHHRSGHPKVNRDEADRVSRRHTPPDNARIPTRLERQRLLAAAEPFFRPFILVGMYTGLRKGSILRLEAENYLNDPGILRVIQKGRTRTQAPDDATAQESPRRPRHRRGATLPLAGRSGGTPLSTKGVGTRLP